MANTGRRQSTPNSGTITARLASGASYPRRDTAEMMRHPERWPRHPALPLIKRSNSPYGKGEVMLGVMFDDGLSVIQVYLVNLCLLPCDLSKVEKRVYLDEEECAAAGWRID